MQREAESGWVTEWLRWEQKAMFDITTCRDFHRKLKADSEDFAKEQDSGRLALNCIITAYHLHEWVWGDWLKTDYAAWKQFGH
jgi:hypothetical protein